MFCFCGILAGNTASARRHEELHDGSKSYTTRRRATRRVEELHDGSKSYTTPRSATRRVNLRKRCDESERYQIRDLTMRERRRHRNLILFLTEHAHAAIVCFSDVLEIRNRRENNNFGVPVRTVEKTSATIKQM